MVARTSLYYRCGSKHIKTWVDLSVEFYVLAWGNLAFRFSRSFMLRALHKKIYVYIWPKSCRIKWWQPTIMFVNHHPCFVLINHQRTLWILSWITPYGLRLPFIMTHCVSGNSLFYDFEHLMYCLSKAWLWMCVSVCTHAPSEILCVLTNKSLVILGERRSCIPACGSKVTMARTPTLKLRRRCRI